MNPSFTSLGTKSFVAGALFAAITSALVAQAEEPAAVEAESRQLVDKRIQEGLQWIADNPPPHRGAFWSLNHAYVRHLVGADNAVAVLNQAILGYGEDYPVDPEVPPTVYSDINPASILYYLYLKPQNHRLLTPESKAAIENVCWRWVFRHSFIEIPADYRGRPSLYNNPTKSVWLITGSENHDARQRSANLLSLQILMIAGEPYGPDARLMSTRNYSYYGNQFGAGYWARALVHAWGWTEETANERLWNGFGYLISDYRPPEILQAIASEKPRSLSGHVPSFRPRPRMDAWHLPCDFRRR